jgi:hypothetical protein
MLAGEILGIDLQRFRGGFSFLGRGKGGDGSGEEDKRNERLVIHNVEVFKRQCPWLLIQIPQESERSHFYGNLSEYDGFVTFGKGIFRFLSAANAVLGTEEFSGIHPVLRLSKHADFSGGRLFAAVQTRSCNPLPRPPNPILSPPSGRETNWPAVTY